ncbi:conserved hypothetical protein [Trichinella spiralis]|uniref:hypothetical protein n=1 Tax=Trichinella spiralis TaxID=6334 RepID=UPI0001EFB76B|nr:conserved hypothetical protein [Trichinella spiralis]
MCVNISIVTHTQLGTSTNKYSKNLEQTETKMDKLGRWLLGANSNQMKEHRKEYFLTSKRRKCASTLANVRTAVDQIYRQRALGCRLRCQWTKDVLFWKKKDERRRLCGRRTTAFPVFVVENLAAVDEYATTDRSKQQQQQQQQQQKQKMEAIIIIVCEEMPVEYVEEGSKMKCCVGVA